MLSIGQNSMEAFAKIIKPYNWHMIPYNLIQLSFRLLEKISRYELYRFKVISILKELVRIYRVLTTVMYHVRTQIFPQLLLLLT